MTIQELLEHMFLTGGFTTRCDLARDNAELVAYAAQRGLITTLTPKDGYGRVWRLSHSGMERIVLTPPVGNSSLSFAPAIQPMVLPAGTRVIG